jgi:magnesium chelatase family protein
MFDTALTKLALTARGHDRVLRVARAIADADGAEAVGTEHLAEALQFRGDYTDCRLQIADCRLTDC